GAHAAAANAVLINPANNVAYSTGDDGTLKFWQLPLASPRPLPAHADAVTALALSADGKQVLTASAAKTVRVSTFENGQQVPQLTGPTAAVTAAAQAPNGSLIAAGTADHQLFFWNAADGKLVSQGLAHNGPVTGVAFHPGSSQLLTAGGDGL